MKNLTLGLLICTLFSCGQTQGPKGLIRGNEKNGPGIQTVEDLIQNLKEDKTALVISVSPGRMKVFVFQEKISKKIMVEHSTFRGYLKTYNESTIQDKRTVALYFEIIEALSWDNSEKPVDLKKNLSILIPFYELTKSKIKEEKEIKIHEALMELE